MIPRIGSASLSVAASPPIMKTRFPSRAPQSPPVTGASRKRTFCFWQADEIFLTNEGEIVLETMYKLPDFKAASAPSFGSSEAHRTDSRAGGSLTMVISTSLAAATSRGDLATVAPAESSFSAREVVRFQTVKRCPAFNKFMAIGRPIRPKPMKPIFRGTAAVFTIGLLAQAIVRCRGAKKCEKIVADSAGNLGSEGRRGGRSTWVEREAARSVPTCASSGRCSGCFRKLRSLYGTLF